MRFLTQTEKDSINEQIKEFKFLEHLFPKFRLMSKTFYRLQVENGLTPPLDEEDFIEANLLDQAKSLCYLAYDLRDNTPDHEIAQIMKQTEMAILEMTEADMEEQFHSITNNRFRKKF